MAKNFDNDDNFDMAEVEDELNLESEAWIAKMLA